MTDQTWTRNEIDSPCLKICVMHPGERMCVGCHRSIEEITNWSKMTPLQRAAITAELPGRANKLKKRRGGRAARLAPNQKS